MSGDTTSQVRPGTCRRALMEFLETGWKEPDDGIWEVRGPRRHFTHSKVMAWVAVDRAVRTSRSSGSKGRSSKWREMRDAIHAEVCEKGYNAEVGAFTQYYGSDALDASLLMIPLVRLPPADRSAGPLDHREDREGAHRGRLRPALPDGRSERRRRPRRDARGRSSPARSGWPTACTLIGRTRRRPRALRAAARVAQRPRACSPRSTTRSRKRQVGNFPQAFSHVSLVNTACNLSGQSLEDVLPSPETVQALRRSMLRHSRRFVADPRFHASGAKRQRPDGTDGASEEHTRASTQEVGSMKALRVTPLQGGHRGHWTKYRSRPNPTALCWSRRSRSGFAERTSRSSRASTDGRLRVRSPRARSRVARSRRRGTGRGSCCGGRPRGGDRAAPGSGARASIVPSGEWDFCRNGQYTERGIKEHDGYCSERYRITPEFAVKVDPKLGLLGVLLEPTSVVAKAWEQVERIGNRATFEPQRALITGAGPIGLLAALLAVQRGLDVTVIDQVTSGPKPDLVADARRALPHRDDRVGGRVT